MINVQFAKLTAAKARLKKTHNLSYTEADGRVTITVEGPPRQVARVERDGGQLKFHPDRSAAHKAVLALLE